MRPLILFLMMGIFFSNNWLFAQRFDFSNKRTKDVISFKFIHNLVVIPLYINGKGPFNFILDTGVEPLIITDSTLIASFFSDSLTATEFPVYRMRGRGVGPEIEAYVINNLTVDIGKSSMNHFPGVLLKDDPFQLSDYMGMVIHGLIGSNFFTSFIVKMEYPSKRLSFYKLDHPPKRKGRRIPIEIIRDKPYVNVVIEDNEHAKDTLLLLIDSGAGHSISLDLTEEEEWMKPKSTIFANLGMGLSGPISGLIGRLEGVRLGDFDFKNVVTAFPEYPNDSLRLIMTDKDGSIGGEILKRFTVTYDYIRQEIYLKKNRYYRLPFEHDMSGMEVYQHVGQGGRFFISRIEPNSPADSAQFLVNDEILSINFKPSKQYSLDEINQLLRKESKSRLFFEILRGDEILFKIIQLKRRI